MNRTSRIRFGLSATRGWRSSRAAAAQNFAGGIHHLARTLSFRQHGSTKSRSTPGPTSPFPLEPVAPFKRCKKLLPSTASVWLSIRFGRQKPPWAACSPRMTAALCVCASARCAIWSSALRSRSPMARWPATGAFGTLGIITRAVFRLHPLPRNARSFSIGTKGAEEARRLIHAIQNSKLAHTALQARFENEAAPIVDILFEGTEVGLDAQEAHLKELAELASLTVTSPDIWNTRQDLWSFAKPEEAAIAKISVLPVEMDKSTTAIAKSAKVRQLRFKTVLQATGIGFLRLEGDPANLRFSLQDLREQFESHGGSLVVLHRPAGMAPIDAWGRASDALPLMKAVKKQLDPRNTLNPGRFVGGI